MDSAPPNVGREDPRHGGETLSSLLTRIQEKQSGDLQVPSGGYGHLGPIRPSMPGPATTLNVPYYPPAGGAMGTPDPYPNHGTYHGHPMYSPGHMYANSSIGGYQPPMMGGHDMRSRHWGGYLPRMYGHVPNSYGPSPASNSYGNSTMNTSNDGATMEKEAAEVATKVSSLIELCEEVAQVDPYISTEMCRSIVQVNFADFPFKDMAFSTLLGFYKTLRKTNDVPPNVMIVLEAVWRAMCTVHDRKDEEQPEEFAADHHPPASRSEVTTVPPSDLEDKPQKRKRGRPRKNPEAVKPDTSDDFSDIVVTQTVSEERAVAIECNGKHGLFRLDTQTCDCSCGMCSLIKTHMGMKELRMAPREFERHAGMSHVKKWRASIHLAAKGKRRPLLKYLTKMGIEILPVQGPDDQLVFKFAPPLGKGIASVTDLTIVPRIQEERERVKNLAILRANNAPGRVQELSLVDEPQNKNAWMVPPQETRIAEPKKDSTSHLEQQHQPAATVENKDDPPQPVVSVEKKSVGRPKKFKPNPQPAAQAIEKAEMGNASPIIQSWRCDPKTLNLYLNVSYGDAKYSGVLPLLGLAEDDANGESIPGMVHQLGGQQVRASPGSDDSWKKSRQKEKLEEYQDLLLRGPSKDSVCALCGLPGEESIPASSKGFFGRSETGLGELLLVKMSAVSTAWVHDQCARWSPEVHDPTGEGILVGIKDAVTRGRRLRCKHCQNKGATLGCFSKRCKSSYHLNCARDVCTYQMHPYLLFCPEHTAEFDSLPTDAITVMSPNGLETKTVRVQHDTSHQP